MSTTNGKISRNQLDMPKSFKLGKWLASQAGMPEFTKTNQLKLTELATKELGFGVTEINLRTIAKAADITLPSSRTGEPRRMKINILRDCLVDIYRQFGQEVPAELEWSDKPTDETELK